MKKRYLVMAILGVIFLLASWPVMASDGSGEDVSQERIDLFVASREMLNEHRKAPNIRVGMIMTTLGEDGEVSVGFKVESNLNKKGAIRLLSEVIYLKSEETLAGFLSLKGLPFEGIRYPIYFGAGAGYANGLKYQVLMGVEFTPNFFAEMKYVNMTGGFGDTHLHLATGMQFTF